MTTYWIPAAIGVALLALSLAGCAGQQSSPATTVEYVSAASQSSQSGQSAQASAPTSRDLPEANDMPENSRASESSSPAAKSSSASAASSGPSAKQLYKKLAIQDMTDDYRDAFVHGDKSKKFQKYIVLHDTETGGEPADIVNSWGGSGEGIAAHFVVGKDGSIAQCVDLDKIGHHAGFGDTGHNELYGVEDESRDDKVGTTPIGDWASDYGMNSYSVGIELIHVGGEGDYPEEQLEALDGLIAYIDAFFGKKCQIIDHKMWRSGNSDTSPEFADYLANYQDHRTHE